MSDDDPTEIWKPVPRFPFYEVSNLGRVRSLPRAYERYEWRRVSVQIVHLAGRMLNRRRPYSTIYLTRWPGDRRHEESIHRLVLTAFVGPCPPGMEACHNDGNPLNNRLDNLRWDTHKENHHDSVQHGTFNMLNLRVKGQNHPKATLTDAEVAAIRATPIARGTKARLAREYHASHTTIRDIVAGKTRRL